MIRKFQQLINRLWFPGQFVLIGFFVGVLYWFLDAAVKSFLFGEGNFSELALHPTPDDAWMRGFTGLLFILFGFGIDKLVATIRSSKTSAELANRAKSDLLANMSHELRTPLNAIIGFSETMLAETFGPIDNDRYREYLGDIHKSGNHLHRLINDILDLSRIEAGSIDLKIENVRLSECISDCMTIIQPQAEKEGISFTGDCLCNTPIEVRADPVRLLQVLINVLSNAIKYNIPGGRVEIWCEENHTSGMGRLFVKDTGLGIKNTYGQSIFDPFSRDPRTATDTEGTGIGLSITRSLMEMMSGGIDFKSTLGEGSTFWIDIPLAEASPAT